MQWGAQYFETLPFVEKSSKTKMPFEMIRTSKRPSTWTSLLLLGRCLTLQCQRHTECTKRDGSKEVLYKACFSHISHGLYLLQSLGRASQTKPVSWLDVQILFRCTSPFFIHLWCIYLHENHKNQRIHVGRHIPYQSHGILWDECRWFTSAGGSTAIFNPRYLTNLEMVSERAEASTPWEIQRSCCFPPGRWFRWKKKHAVGFYGYRDLERRKHHRIIWKMFNTY